MRKKLLDLLVPQKIYSETMSASFGSAMFKTSVSRSRETMFPYDLFFKDDNSTRL